ncbi:MAG: RidA family protein [Planctomycetota bacterium]
MEKVDMKVQLEKVFNNLKAGLDSCGTTLDSIVKTTMFVTDMAEFQKLADLRKTLFQNAPSQIH